jgi:hypothetical protein
MSVISGAGGAGPDNAIYYPRYFALRVGSCCFPKGHVWYCDPSVRWMWNSIIRFWSNQLNARITVRLLVCESFACGTDSIDGCQLKADTCPLGR